MPDDAAPDRRIAEMHEAWRATLGPVGPGPGEEFFAELAGVDELDPLQRQAVLDVRGALSRLRPAHVRPQDTTGWLNDNGYYLTLRIAHELEPEVRIELAYGDGYLGLDWPGGTERDGWEWSPLLARTVEALLSGRNQQTVLSRLGRPYAIDTETWDAQGGNRHRHRRLWIRPRARLLGLVPAATVRARRSISFDRYPAIVMEPS